MNILPSLWQPLIDISWMRLKSPRTGSASKLARVLHLQLFFATCKPPACHASKLTLPFVWSPVSKRLLSPDCQSELSSTPASQELRHAADSSAAAEIKLLRWMRLGERDGNVLLFVCECVCFITELGEGMLRSSLLTYSPHAELWCSHGWQGLNSACNIFKPHSLLFSIAFHPGWACVISVSKKCLLKTAHPSSLLLSTNYYWH